MRSHWRRTGSRVNCGSSPTFSSIKSPSLRVPALVPARSGYRSVRPNYSPTPSPCLCRRPCIRHTEHVRIKYACRKDGESAIRTAFAQPSSLPKPNASAGLPAQIGVSIFVDHMPLNRQEAAYKRHGVVLPRATLCDWKLDMAELREVLLPPLKKHILKAPRLRSDDTTMPLQEPGRGSTKTVRLWVYLGAGQRQENGLWADYSPAALSEFTASQEAIHPLTFLADSEGYLQVDACSGDLALSRTGRVIPVGCWAHYLDTNFICSSKREWRIPRASA